MRAKAGLFEREISCRTITLCICILCVVFVIKHSLNTVKRVIFGGQNIRGSAILRHFVGNIFVVAAWIVGKGRQGRFIRGQTSNHENHKYFAPRKLPAIR